MNLIGNLESPKVLVIGVFHGDEPQGKYLIEKYYETNPNTSLLFLPCLNKTGHQKGTRKNSNGVDLNRNFPTKNWVRTNIEDDYYGEIFRLAKKKQNLLSKLWKNTALSLYWHFMHHIKS